MKEQKVKLTNRSVGFNTKINWKVRMDINTTNPRAIYPGFLCQKYPGFAAVWAEAGKMKGISSGASSQTVTTILLQMLLNTGVRDLASVSLGATADRVRARLMAIITSPQYKHVSPKMVRDIMMQELEAEINKGETSND